MKIHLIMFLLIFSYISVNAQKAELIKGKWQFKDIADKGKLDSLTLKEANLLFGKVEMEFAANGKYIWGKTVTGTWSLNKNANKVVISSNGRTNELEIKKLTKTELRLNMGKATIVMERPPQKQQQALNERSTNNELSEFKEVDKNSREVFSIFNRLETAHQKKVNELLSYLQASMVMNNKGDFLRRLQWPSYSLEIRQNYCKNLDEDIKNYRMQLENLNIQNGENELNDHLVGYLQSTVNFSSSCREWANTISQIDADNDEILSVLTALEKASQKMKEENSRVWQLIPNYKQRNGLQ